MKKKYVIENLVYDELGKTVLRMHNERFRDADHIDDHHRYKENEPISFSNTIRALSYNQILTEITKGERKLLSPHGLLKYWGSIPEIKMTYADTNAIAVYPNGDDTNETLRKVVLEMIGERYQSIEVPLLVIGIGVKKDRRMKSGFTFIETEHMQVKEAPFLLKGGKIIYSGENGIISSEEGIQLYVPPRNSGLRGVFRNRDSMIGADGHEFFVSDKHSRVQVIREEKNLESKID